jgi:hypothetical protein
MFLTISCQSADKKKVNDGLKHQTVNTFYADKADFDIIYPAELERKPAEENRGETDRAGSLTAIDFDIEEKEVQVMEVLFHTEKSCAKFYDLVKDEGPEGDFFDESWYLPQEFINQRQALQEKKNYEGFEYVKYNGVEFLYKCSLTNGETFGECITFKNNIRILTTFGSAKECQDVTEQIKSLFAKLEFKKHSL